MIIFVCAIKNIKSTSENMTLQGKCYHSMQRQNFLSGDGNLRSDCTHNLCIRSAKCLTLFDSQGTLCPQIPVFLEKISEHIKKYMTFERQ